MLDFDNELKKLNSGQLKAVEAIEGPVLVVAGPGTGKTHILALRIANILKKTGAFPRDILCLTFTESGVYAMKEKLIQMIGNDAYYVNINTFHGFCNEVIQSNPDKFAFAKELVQLDDLSRIKIIQGIIDSYPVNEAEKVSLIPFYDKYSYVNNIISSIQTLKREGISPQNLETITSEDITRLEENKEINAKTGKPKSNWVNEYNNAKRNAELAKMYKSYVAILTERGLYDYEDMILFVIDKFQSDPELLSDYLEKYLYILVDEYQDTNGAQNQILKLLGSFDKSPNIFAVGDDDQAIYRFQGGNVENLLFFSGQFENVKTIPVTVNYRSSQTILDAASSVIKNNKARLVSLVKDLNKDLTSGLKKENRNTQILGFSTSQIENKFIVKKIGELVKKGSKYSDIAILYRKHSDSDDIVDVMLKNNIPIKLHKGGNLLEEIVVKQFLDLLKVVNGDETDDLNLLVFKVLNYKFAGFDAEETYKLTRLFKSIPTERNKLANLFDLLLDTAILEKSDLKQSERFKAFTNKILEWKKDSYNLPLIELVEKIATESEYLNFIFKHEGNEDFNTADINAFLSFFDFVKSVNKNSKNISLSEFLNDIRIIEQNKIQISVDELDIKSDAVNLLTAHSAKGLQFKYVFIINCYDGNWGGRRNRNIIKLPNAVFDLTKKDELFEKYSEIDFENEDERRLFYVAFTRAMEQVFITYAGAYPSGNSLKQVTLCKFVGEIDPQLVEYPDVTEIEKIDVDYLKNSLSYNQRSEQSQSEQEYLREILKEFRLSASSLNEYMKCPKKFKYERLIKVPQKRNKILLMGTAIHKALENYFRELKAGNAKDKFYLTSAYTKFLDRQLLSKIDYEDTLAQGKKILSEYFEFYESKFIKPLELEYGFYNKHVFLPITNSEPVRLTGEIDKIDQISDAEIATQDTLFNQQSLAVRLVDYKTKTPESKNGIMGLTKSSDGAMFRQLVFYTLLCDLDESFRPFVGSSKYNVAEVQIDFLKPSKNGSYKKENFVITEKNKEELKNVIEDVVKRIRNLEFEGSEEYPLCGECMWCQLSN